MRLSALKVCLALAVVVLCQSGVRAQSTTCANLAADLASLNRRAPIYDPFGDAVSRQSSALARAQSDYEHACSTGLFSRPSPNCPVMAERIQAMQANLGKLQKTAPRFAPKDDGARERLTALMNRNHCGEAGGGTVATDRTPPGALTNGLPIAAAPGSRPADIFGFRQSPGPPDQSLGRTFTLQGPDGPVTYREEPGGRIYAIGPAARLEPPRDRRSPIITNSPDDEDGPPRNSSDLGDDQSGLDGGGSFRTLCVRTCDGYYFPISYSATRNKFGNDAEVCHARCPGTETKLYAVKTPGEDGEQSFAADSGEPYSKLPNALRYRREVVNACTCGRPDPSLMPLTALPQEDINKDGSLKVGDPRAGLPVPDARPAYGEDPETLADMAADFVPHVIEPAKDVAIAPDLLRGPAVPKTVRVVGPKFYADR